MREWKIKRIKDFLSFCSGDTLTSEMLVENGDYPVYGGNGIRGYYSQYNRDGNYILVGRVGALCGNIHNVYGKFWATEHALIGTPIGNFDTRWLSYLLHDMNLGQHSIASAQPVLSISKIARLELPVPSPEEQEAIAAYLDRECEKIGQQIELLERKADAYKRLRRSIINRAVTRGLSSSAGRSATAENPDAPLKPSGIPWIDFIPEHWDIKRGKSIFQEVYRDVLPEDGTVTCFRDGEVTLRTNRRTTGFTESEKEIGYHGVRVGDLVIHQMDAFAGSIGISDSDGKCSPICIVCRPLHEDEADLGYYCQLLRVMAHSGFIQSLAKGIRERTTDFRYKTLVTLHFPVPPYIEQQQIAAYLNEKCGKIDAIIEKIGTQVERLKELKRSLINEVVTGKRAITTCKP